MVRPEREYVTPHALTTAEVKVVIEDYRLASLAAKEAGFDGVEVHGANGYLPHQFLSLESNTRDDEYGGNLENRARFMLEAVDAAISVWGADRVGLHISPQYTDGGVFAGQSQTMSTSCIKSLPAISLLFAVVSRGNQMPG